MVTQESERESKTRSRGRQKELLKGALWLCWGFLLTADLFWSRPAHISRWFGLWYVMIAGFAIVCALPIRWIMRIFFGKSEHVQVASPQLQQRARNRFKSEIDQLEKLGFDYAFLDGQNFFLFRIALLFPLLVQFMKLSFREVMTLTGAANLLTVYTVFVSRDKTTYAHSNGLGTVFETAFEDATILLTKNFGDSTGYGPVVIAQVMNKASISSMWAEHVWRIQMLETEGRHADHKPSFETYVRISREEYQLM
jgi:hypothetical protein